MNADLISQIEDRYKNLQHDPEAFLKTLLYVKPLSYWDYIQVDTLLSLQKPRTDFPDEYIFIVYHQITELILTLISHELKQVVYGENVKQEMVIEKINRVNRYANILVDSFTVMSKGMDFKEYNTFRQALTPASGFQTVSFRMIEFYCTDLINLVRPEHHSKLNADSKVPDYFEYLYWKDAGYDRQSGKKSLMLRMFEDKYNTSMIEVATEMKTKNLNHQFLKNIEFTDEIKNVFREFDYIINIVWPLAHLKTAEHYLIAAGHKTSSTGMSDWQKYLHPNFQQRKFFPNVWSAEELSNWGNFELKF